MENSLKRIGIPGDIFGYTTWGKHDFPLVYNFLIVKIPACLICLGKVNFLITLATDRPYSQQKFLFGAVPFSDLEKYFALVGF